VQRFFPLPSAGSVIRLKLRTAPGSLALQAGDVAAGADPDRQRSGGREGRPAAVNDRVADLIGTTNTTATNALTGATTGTNKVMMTTFGGTSTFQIAGDQSAQSYIAGDTQSSVSTTNLGVGM
jgi:hypothetical protein